MARWTDLATWHGPSPNSGPALTVHRGLVLHIAQGFFGGTIAWQKNPNARTSSHFIVGKLSGECAQMVDTDVQAWTQRAGNDDWMSAEEVGFVPDALTPWQVERTAQLFARGHVDYGWPLQVAHNPSERGLGHHSMDREGIDPEWGHDECPGINIINQKLAIVQRAQAIINGGYSMAVESAVKFIDGRVEAMASGRETVADNPAFLGIGSPVWIVAQVNKIVSDLASVKTTVENITVTMTTEQIQLLAMLIAQALPPGQQITVTQIRDACVEAVGTVLTMGTDATLPIEEDEGDEPA